MSCTFDQPHGDCNDVTHKFQALQSELAEAKRELVTVRKELEEKEMLLVAKDALNYGTGFMQDGKHVSYETVMKSPYELELELKLEKTSKLAEGLAGALKGAKVANPYGLNTGIDAALTAWEEFRKK